MINIKDFSTLELRIGTIEKVEPFPEAKKAAYKLCINFGSHGKKWSSAQIIKNYSLKELKGLQILAAMNLGDKKIGPFTSEVLVMGAEDRNGNIVLLEPEREIQNGSKAS
ncbi:MAG: tRNA-binding protein [Candidatus Marinimicrobia bacterium]|jgi:tRNA-binding protein|nr:tRNA-binding protein [Candidatus Neomarinimicrobiota bacterium]MDP6612315.1 tRNA-binding protein [Candidatus Neomarinimicrobiota bacterium]|tara:strand:+ start:2925 stop:3254 length:330 start_codon:yes stop_codon:yes gene_type:complete